MDTSTEFSVVERIEVANYTGHLSHDENKVRWFYTEREARTYFNQHVNGFNVFELWEHRRFNAERELIVASRCPVLQIA